MVNWYYVLGSERVGPVGIDTLKQLFLKDEINVDTYVWKKGFQSWERLKDVGELNFNKIDATAIPDLPISNSIESLFETKDDFSFKAEMESVNGNNIFSVLAQEELVSEVVSESSSPEIFFSFNWKTVNPNEDIFFVKIGKDRKGLTETNIFGPYSLVELKEALNEKRINLETLVFTPGMNSWTKIQETPMNENVKSRNGSGLSLNEVPLVMVFEHSPLPLITVIKKAGVHDGVLLGAGPFSEFKDKTVKASLYIGNEIKVKNVKVRVQGYDKREQKIECRFVDMDQDAVKIMLNHAV